MFTCAGVTHFTGSAEVVTSLLTGGTQASRLHWGKTSGTWGVAGIPSEIPTQDAWRQQEGLNWTHWVDKRVCVRDDAYTCVYGEGAFKCAGGGWVGVFTCAGVAHFTGSAEVVTSLLTRGTQTSRLHWGKTSGAWGAAEILSESATQVAWRQ